MVDGFGRATSAMVSHGKQVDIALDDGRTISVVIGDRYLTTLLVDGDNVITVSDAKLPD